MNPHRRLAVIIEELKVAQSRAADGEGRLLASPAAPPSPRKEAIMDHSTGPWRYPPRRRASAPDALHGLLSFARLACLLIVLGGLLVSGQHIITGIAYAMRVQGENQ
mgnify:CR=1 FL=1